MLKLAEFNSTIYSFNKKTWVSDTPTQVTPMVLETKANYPLFHSTAVHGLSPHEKKEVNTSMRV